MQISFITGDDATGHLVEAGVDKVQVLETAKVGVVNHSTIVSSMIVYPNPLAENSQIVYQLNDLAKAAKIELIDFQGRIIKTYALHADRGHMNLDFPVATGIYLLKLTNGNEQLIQKIIK
jgi:hypothetical protein